MIKKLKLTIASLLMMVSMGAPALVPAVAYADSNNITQNVCNGSTAAAEGADKGTGASCNVQGSDTNDNVKKLASKIVNLFSVIVGAVAIIMIIYGGFRYITSGGDSGRVGNAKNTLIYAIIGLIIVALAQFIVKYVLTASANAV
jgi:energy-converting hydrogenase Eha subunit B